MFHGRHSYRHLAWRHEHIVSPRPVAHGASDLIPASRAPAALPRSRLRCASAIRRRETHPRCNAANGLEQLGFLQQKGQRRQQGQCQMARKASEILRLGIRGCRRRLVFRPRRRWQVLAVDQHSTGNHPVIASDNIIVLLSRSESGGDSYIAVVNVSESHQTIATTGSISTWRPAAATCATFGGTRICTPAHRLTLL